MNRDVRKEALEKEESYYSSGPYQCGMKASVILDHSEGIWSMPGDVVGGEISTDGLLSKPPP